MVHAQRAWGGCWYRKFCPAYDALASAALRQRAKRRSFAHWLKNDETAYRGDSMTFKSKSVELPRNSGAYIPEMSAGKAVKVPGASARS